MTDFLDTKIREIRERLDELRPLVEEAKRLEGALDVLDDKREKEIPPEAGINADPSIARPSRPKAKRAPRGETRAKVLAVVAERPGVSAAEVSQATGINKQTTYSTLSKLENADHAIKSEVLPSMVKGYSVITQDEPVSLRVQTPGPPTVKADSEVAYVTQEG